MPMSNYRTLKQAELAQEFILAYDLTAEQISFDGENIEPTFDFEALSTLALRLANFTDIQVTLYDVNTQTGYVSCQCSVELPGGARRSFFGVSFIGETLPSGETINDQITASNI